jgi:hypothetical protein
MKPAKVLGEVGIDVAAVFVSLIVLFIIVPVRFFNRLIETLVAGETKWKNRN